MDGRLAPALQQALHRFAKPWYRLRAVHVFRDDASLSANPALWPSIEQALAASRFFVLLASPQAARSRWVAREADYWRRHKPPANVLLVLTEGQLVWDEAAGDFDWARTTALPTSLRGLFKEEPRYIDLRWARTEEHLSLNDPRFRDGVADLAAPLHGRDKDELFGEDVRQHRRTVRLARSAIAALALLAVLTSTAAFVAVDRGNEARAQRDRAEEEALVALSRQLAAEATAAADDQHDLALLLAAQAYATRPTAQSKSGLLQVLLRSPNLVGYLPRTAGTTRLAFQPREGVLAVGRANGEVALWDALARRRLQALSSAHRAEVTALEFSGDGRRLASGAADGTVSVWDLSGGPLSSHDLAGRIEAVAFDADGTRVAATSDKAGTVVWDAATGRRLHALPLGSGGDTLIFVDAQTLVVAHGQGWIERWDLGTSPPSRTERNVGLGQPLVSAYSPDLRHFSAVTLGQERPYLVEVAGGASLPDLRGPTVDVGEMAFSGDGRILATAGRGRVVLWDTRKREALPEVLTGVPEQPRTVEGQSLALALSHDGGKVAAAGQRGVAVWDLGAHLLLEELGAAGAQPLSEVPNAVRASSSAAFSPDGRLLAWSVLPTMEPDGRVVVWDLVRGREVLRFPSLVAVGFSPGGQRVAGQSTEEDFTVVDLRTRERKRVPELPWKAERREPGSSLPGRLWSVESGASGLGASIAFDGTLTLWDVARRQPLGTLPVPGAFDFSDLVFDPTGQRLAVATAGGAMSVVQVTPDAWRAHACTLVARDLTGEERRLHLGGRDLPRPCP